MTRFRFSMRHLLLAVLALGAALAVLQWDSPLAASAAYTLFLALLALGLAGAFCRRGTARAFWIGFTVFGWVYGEAAFPAAGVASRSGWLAGGFVPQPGYQPQSPSPALLTDLLFDYAAIDSRLRTGSKVTAQWRSGVYYEATITQVDGGRYLVAWTDGSAPSWVARNQIQLLNYSGRQAAHSILAILSAVFGGALCEMFFGRMVDGEGRADPGRGRSARLSGPRRPGATVDGVGRG
jgi:hypothetical protein